jgi:hypothetical protein
MYVRPLNIGRDGKTPAGVIRAPSKQDITLKLLISRFPTEPIAVTSHGLGWRAPLQYQFVLAIHVPPLMAEIIFLIASGHYLSGSVLPRG